jgi:hypothetical protein
VARVYYIRCAQRVLGTNRVRLFPPFTHLCALKPSRSYIFFPETANLSLEDVDHLFEKGGITGGVWGAPGGRTVIAHSDRISGPDVIRNIKDEEGDIMKGKMEHVERRSDSASEKR